VGAAGVTNLHAIIKPANKIAKVIIRFLMVFMVQSPDYFLKFIEQLITAQKISR
jgi:hypothetical protein